MLRMTRIGALAAALGLGLALPLAGVTVGEARSFGGGGFHGGGFHGGGFHGGFRGGGFHSGFGGFRHFGGARFGGLRGFHHFGAGHFAGHRLGGVHFGARGLAGRHFGAQNFTAHAFGHHGRAGNFAGLRGAHGFAHRGFAHAGFARNAFGGRHAWHAWNRNYAGYGWNGYGWGGWAGPVFWPYFYGDLLSYALWPYDFYDPFFGYGPDFLLWSMFWPGPYYDYGPDYFSGWEEDPYAIYAYAGGTSSQEQAASEYMAKAEESCTALAPGIADVPVDRIERAIRPNNTQIAILNDLKAASAKANGILQASCPSEPPLTPVDRLNAMGKRIDAMIQAVQIIRAPLTTLDNSLEDKQRERFNAIALGVRARRKQTPAQATGLNDLCAAQAKDFTNLPIDAIEQTVKPKGPEQTTDLTTLKDASAKAAKSMESSCPSTMPQTLTDRFNAITTRLDAMAGAVKTVEPALKTFYSSLNDEQKAAFDVMPTAVGAEQSQAQSK